MSQSRQLILTPGGPQVDPTTGSVQFIGTATVILRYAGFTILTDPNFLHKGEKVALGYGLRSARLTDPAIEIEDLPPLDLVVLSHMHEDHFDRVAAQKLDRSVPIVTTQHAAKSLKKMGFTSPYALDTWETLDVTKGEARLRVTSMPGRHGPGPLARVLPPVMGSLLHFQPVARSAGLRLYVSGDTLVYPQLREIHRWYPDVDLALLHLGGTRALGILVTMDGKQGVELLRIIAPSEAIPIHYNDYTVFKSPLEDFRKEVEAAGLQDIVRYLSHGETHTFHVPESRLNGS